MADTINNSGKNTTAWIVGIVAIVVLVLLFMFFMPRTDMNDTVPAAETTDTGNQGDTFLPPVINNTTINATTTNMNSTTTVR